MVCEIEERGVDELFEQSEFDALRWIMLCCAESVCQLMVSILYDE